MKPLGISWINKGFFSLMCKGILLITPSHRSPCQHMQGPFAIFHVQGKAFLSAREQKTETLEKKINRILVQKKKKLLVSLVGTWFRTCAWYFLPFLLCLLSSSPSPRGWFLYVPKWKLCFGEIKSKVCILLILLSGCLTTSWHSFSL